jgi:Phosphodiester glycosidase
MRRNGLYAVLTWPVDDKGMSRVRVWCSWLVLVALLGSSMAEPFSPPMPDPDPSISEPLEQPVTNPTATDPITPTPQSVQPSVIVKPAVFRPKPAAPRVSKQKNSTKSIVLEQKRVRGIDVKIVRVNLWDRRVFVSPVMPANGLGKGGERFDRLVAGSSAIAIVNGGYFHPRSFSLAGDLVVKGRHLTTQGPVRTALGITSDGRATVTAGATSGKIAWREFETAISNGPWVLRQGKIMVYPREEGYTDRAIERPAPRSAVGVTSQHKLFIISTRQKINLYDLAKLMKALGAREAIALDGGSSVGLAWKGKVLIRPARKIAYGIGVYVRP